MKATSVHRPEHKVLALMLRELRLEAGFTQAEAAEALGISQTALSDVEIGERGIDFLFVVDVCRLYEKVPEEFMAGFMKAVSGRKGKIPARLVRRDRKRPV
jgi:transcriptional regulator with XRE-family HTH domain